jgi:hypothetical protein
VSEDKASAGLEDPLVARSVRRNADFKTALTAAAELDHEFAVLLARANASEARSLVQTPIELWKQRLCGVVAPVELEDSGDEEMDMGAPVPAGVRGSVIYRCGRTLKDGRKCNRIVAVGWGLKGAIPPERVGRTSISTHAGVLKVRASIGGQDKIGVVKAMPLDSVRMGFYTAGEHLPGRPWGVLGVCLGGHREELVNVNALAHAIQVSARKSVYTT